MRALIFREKGNAEDVLKLEETSLEPCKPGEITIRTIASPINPNDFMFIEKQYRVVPEFPQIAGFEACGIVVDNHGATNVANGTLVAYRHKNAWGELVNVPIEKIVPLPDTFPIAKAAQLSLNPLTAWALLEQSRATAGAWIVLSAGTSAVSKLIIQFAKRKGIKTIAIVRETTQTELLLSLGASAVIPDTHTEDIAREILKIAGTEPICSFIDAVGGRLATEVISTIGPNGSVICYGLLSNENVSYHNADLIFRLLTIEGFGIDKWITGKSEEAMREIWEQIISSIGEPDFVMQTAGRYAPEEYVAAIRESRTASTGKVLFYFGSK